MGFPNISSLYAVVLAKFRNKYRIESNRAPFWDYGWCALYFITICTKYRIHWFGYVKDDRMILSDIGKIVESQWLITFEMRPDMNLTMGEFVVMPDHFHAIIGIGKNPYNTTTDHSDPQSTQRAQPDDLNPSIENPRPTPKNKFAPQTKNLGSIIRGFKAGVTTNARMINPDFGWQTRYNDHIIRNEKGFKKISQYIKDNPKNWKE